MDASVLVHRNYQNAKMEGFGFREVIQLICHHNPERFFQLLMTSYLYQKTLLDFSFIFAP